MRSPSSSGHRRRHPRAAVLAAPLLLTAALSPAAVAHAQNLTFDLDPAGLTAPPGSSVLFQGTITNGSGAEVFLNSISFVFDAPAGGFFSGNDAPFFESVPPSLAAGATPYAGPLFGVDIAAGAASGQYSGTVSLLGGADDDALSVLASQRFQVTVASAIPEAGTGLLSLAAATTAAAVCARGRIRRRTWRDPARTA